MPLCVNHVLSANLATFFLKLFLRFVFVFAGIKFYFPVIGSSAEVIIRFSIDVAGTRQVYLDVFDSVADVVMC